MRHVFYAFADCSLVDWIQNGHLNRGLNFTIPCIENFGESCSQSIKKILFSKESLLGTERF